MINYATILSDFDDRGTLLKWLKKVEEALRDAGLDDVTVNVVDDTHITLSFVFADGSSVTSSVIELPEGPQGPQGVPGQDATPVYANILVPPAAPFLSSISVNGTGYNVFAGDSWGLTSVGATVGQVLTADGTNGVSWATPTAPDTGEETVKLVDSSYQDTGKTATCRWIKYGQTAVVTIDITTFVTSAYYAVELPAALQGFENTKQRGLFIGATTGTAKYNLCETDTAAPDTGKYIHFIDAMGMNYTMPSATMGTLNITLHYSA